MNKIKIITTSIPAINPNSDFNLEITLDDVTNLDLCKLDQNLLIQTFVDYGKSKELFTELVEGNEDLIFDYLEKNMEELHTICEALGCILIKN